jgi:hypothetical protein
MPAITDVLTTPSKRGGKKELCNFLKSRRYEQKNEVINQFFLLL